MRVVVLTCLITLAAALSSYYYVYQYKVTDPLLARITQLTGVKDVTFTTVGNKRRIVLSLSASADLPDVHYVVSQCGAEAFGKRFGGVVIRDDRSAELAETYYQMHFHIQQGIATGQFTQMAVGLAQIAKQEQLDDYRVYVDTEYVYLQLSKDGSTLFELIPRSPETLQATSVAGGYAS
jgi:hypothetical protein